MDQIYKPCMKLVEDTVEQQIGVEVELSATTSHLVKHSVGGCKDCVYWRPSTNQQVELVSKWSCWEKHEVSGVKSSVVRIITALPDT